MRDTLITILLCCSTLCTAGGQVRYRSESIKAAVTKLGLAKAVDTLKAGYTLLSYNGRRLCISVNAEREVDHIGIPLFSRQMRNLQPSPIYNYLEYAMLDHQYAISASPLTYRDLKFKKGGWMELGKMGDTADVSIYNIDGKHYRVLWKTGQKTVAEVMFPIQYEQLESSTHKELEENFVHDMKHKKDLVPQHVAEPSMETLELVYADGDERFYKRNGATLFADYITANTFYYTKDSKGPTLLNDHRYPGETICNMLLTGGVGGERLEMELVVMRQDFSRDTLVTSVAQLARLLMESGCKNYFGLKKSTKTELAFSLYAANRQSGYVHLIMFDNVPQDILQSKRRLRAMAYLYIPISNIKEMFADKKQ